MLMMKFPGKLMTANVCLIFFDQYANCVVKKIIFTSDIPVINDQTNAAA
jgi:hypothetical protein